MSETEPENNRNRIRREKALEYFSQHRAQRFIANLIIKSEQKARYGRDYKDTDSQPGMLEGSIVGNPLRFPVQDEESKLEVMKAAGGSWVGYDFRAPDMFPRAYEKGYRHLIMEGRLMGIVLEEVKDNDPEEETPLGLLRLTNFDHIIQLDNYTVAELVDLGIITERSYGEAYDRVGLYDQYVDELRSRSVVDEPVFQVTPKGNTLTMLVPDRGPKSPEKEKEVSWIHVPVLRPAIA